MTVQVTVRLPDDIAEFIDSRVAAGEGSRATVIADAVARERRRLAMEEEIRIVEEVRARGESLYPDLDGWVRSADFGDVDEA